MIGDRIKQRREELNMSQEELAKRIGYKSRSSINKIELNLSDVPQKKVPEFAKVLNVSIGYLMDETTNVKSHDETQQFTTVDEAMLFLIKSPVVSAYGGYDLDKMSDDEIVDFANELSSLFKVIAERRKK